MEDIFLAYGVRGIAGRTLNENYVKKIAWAFGKFLIGQSQKENPSVLLMRDTRLSSPDFYRTAYAGLLHSGANVIAADMATTPMCVFAISHLSADGGFVITASHNPPEYNGIKFFARHAFQMGLDTGLGTVEQLSGSAPDIPDAQVKERIGVADEYVDFLATKFSHLGKLGELLNVAIDNGNGAASVILDRLLPRFPWLAAEKLFWEPDGNFPGRGPNPLLKNALAPLQKLVRNGKFDFGVAFDADGDRVFFVDEKGNAIQSDFIMAWFADEFLEKERGAYIVVPIGSPRIVEDVVKEKSGNLVFSKVGPVFMRPNMKAKNAVLGAERSGHYHFRDFFFADSGIWALFKFLEFYLAKRMPLSEILKPYEKYHSTGEINLGVKDRDTVIEKIKNAFAPKAVATSDLDGFFGDMGEWWMLARPSNTEPIVRIVVESADETTFKTAKNIVMSLIEPDILR